MFSLGEMVMLKPKGVKDFSSPLLLDLIKPGDLGTIVKLDEDNYGPKARYVVQFSTEAGLKFQAIKQKNLERLLKVQDKDEAYENDVNEGIDAILDDIQKDVLEATTMYVEELRRIFKQYQ